MNHARFLWAGKSREGGKTFPSRFFGFLFFLYLGEMAKVVKRTLINYKYFQLPFYMGIINHNVFGCAFYTKKKKTEAKNIIGFGGKQSKAKCARRKTKKAERNKKRAKKRFLCAWLWFFNLLMGGKLVCSWTAHRTRKEKWTLTIRDKTIFTNSTLSLLLLRNLILFLNL